VLFYVLFVSIVLYYVLFVCKCVLYYCHRVATRLQLTNILYHIYFEKNLSLCHTVHQNFDVAWPRVEHEPPQDMCFF